MRTLAVALILTFSTMAQAAVPAIRSCRSLFHDEAQKPAQRAEAPAPAPEPPLEYMEKMYLLQVGNPSTRQFHEEQIGEIMSIPQKDRNCVYRYTCGWFLPSTLKGIIPPHGAEMEMTAINRREFYDSVYGKYDDHFDKELIDKLVATDEILEMERTKYAEVRSLRGLLGTYRWFSAKFGWRDRQDDTMSNLPYEKINEIRGVPELKVTEFLKKIGREKDIGIVEIGKFANLADTVDLQGRTTEMIEMAWVRDARPDDIYIAHVTTLSRARHFQRKYGFQIAETFTVPGSTKPEAILWVRGYQMQAHLKKLLNITISNSNDAFVQIEPILPGETREEIQRLHGRAR